MKLVKIKSESDGLELELAISVPNVAPKAIVQISHGMSEHKESYFEFMNYLSDNGYIAIINDHRGHGASVKSKEDLGYFYTEDINYIVDDLHCVTKYIKSLYPNLKVNLISHSMGTLVARNYLKKYDDELSKLVLIGPPTKNSLTKIGIVLANISKLFHHPKSPDKFMDRIVFSTFTSRKNGRNNWITTDENAVEKFSKDELSWYVYTSNGYINLIKLMDKAYTKKDWLVKNGEMPILLMAGSLDKVIRSKVKFNDLVLFLKERGYKNIAYKMYDGKKHDLMNEVNKYEVFKDILNYIEE